MSLTFFGEVNSRPFSNADFYTELDNTMTRMFKNVSRVMNKQITGDSLIYTEENEGRTPLLIINKIPIAR